MKVSRIVIIICALVSFLQVGLQLLDSNFPDETVRAFAVYVLESKLSDESLEAYLLQLTQVSNTSRAAE